jgi:hypothetical protein
MLIYLAPPIVTWLLVSLGYRLHRYLGRALSFLGFLALHFADLPGGIAAACAEHARFSELRTTLAIVALLLAGAALLAAVLLTKPNGTRFPQVLCGSHHRCSHDDDAPRL